MHKARVLRVLQYQPQSHVVCGWFHRRKTLTRTIRRGVSPSPKIDSGFQADAVGCPK
ncbi:hypothetical protein AGR4A_Cc80276 [Agrobacterium tumefaciens str. B6]|uniref:Uncharacterized protein n=1 Tax=Agrobacterium tumefaciens str. B6 TaxID=1183423 RepID=A0A822V5N2_AGRTU|nr:hypothetical protein AGR4A_Cc80276 [Agrobacterium tumefaciens str. B6]